MAKHDETAADWTEPIMTRVSERAHKKAVEKLNQLGGISMSAWLRTVIYRELGLAKEDKEHG